MTDVLDVVGLIAIAVAGFLIALSVGFALLGAGCLAVSYGITRKKRKAAEAELARRARLTS